MSILNIRKAERAGARLVIGLGGISGSGKTYSALQVAWGLANGDASKVGLLDTENRRGSLYANTLVDAKGEIHQFLIGDLYAPFSPARYRDAILEFQAAGVEVLVIDSVSHEWEGIGGCEDIAHAGDPKVPRWNKAKAEHKSFMNALLASDMHVIVCMRAREKVKMVKVNGATAFEPIGVMPIQEKSFTFELTASMMMWNEGKEQQVLKCPAELRNILGRGNDYLTAKDGLALRKWVDGGAKIDPEIQSAQNALRTTTEKGMDALEKAWTALAKPMQKKLGAAFLQELKTAALSFDEQRKLAESGDGHRVDELNDALRDGDQPQE